MIEWKQEYTDEQIQRIADAIWGNRLSAGESPVEVTDLSGVRSQRDCPDQPNGATPSDVPSQLPRLLHPRPRPVSPGAWARADIGRA